MYAHLYGPRYIACQCAKSLLGQSPGTLQPLFFLNAMRRIGLHPGQDSQHALPGHQFAPPGPQRDLGEALADQRRWTRAAKQSLSSKACLHKSREEREPMERNSVAMVTPGRPSPCCSVSCCHCSFDPLRRTETTWDPNPESSTSKNP